MANNNLSQLFNRFVFFGADGAEFFCHATAVVTATRRTYCFVPEMTHNSAASPTKIRVVKLALNPNRWQSILRAAPYLFGGFNGMVQTKLITGSLPLGAVDAAFFIVTPANSTPTSINITRLGGLDPFVPILRQPLQVFIQVFIHRSFSVNHL